MIKKNYYLIAITIFFIAFFALSVGNEKEIEEKDASLNENLEIELTREITDPTEIDEIEEIRAPKTSGAWVLSNFTIDNDGGTPGAMTWAEAKALPAGWVSGNGNSGDPYIIENVTVNGQGWRNCIKIQDSTAYFIIRNCTLYNAKGNIDWTGNLELENVQNGKVIGNNISKNQDFVGIMLHDSDNNLIANNTCNNNPNSGIFVIGNTNTITGNNISYCGGGISVYGVGDDNTVSNNRFTNNGKGIAMRGTTGCDNNIFTQNNVSLNYYGIYLDLNNDYNTFSGNTIANNTYGIYLTGSGPNYNDGNTFSNNLIAYNDYSVDIADSYCDDNHFYHNNFTQNKYNAIDDGTNNDWDNGYIGNYWHNFTGDTDSNDDGIGDTLDYSISGSASNQDTLPFFDDGYDGGILNIDDNGYYSWNWEFSSTFDWCSGSGTESDPYIIEDLKINASSGNGILINNSINVDFIIQNCTIYDSMAGSYAGNIYGCIRLEDSSKGRIYSNNLSQTSSGDITNGGLVLYDCTNIIIINNTFDGTKYGILMRYSNENLIYNNTVNDQQHVGIFLHTECHYNNITFNNVSYNGIHGIALYDNCTYNRIVNNTANGNGQYGIILCRQYSPSPYLGGFYNTIINNTANNNGIHGILLDHESDYNTIARNIITGNTQYGIAIDSTANENNIIGNILNNNPSGGIYDLASDNIEIMNKIDGACTPFIIDDDGGTANSITWADVKMYVLWFSGAGSWNDPYIIEDITVDAEGSGSGITVQDSNVPFIIRDCNIKGSGTTGVADDGVGDAGIKLVRVNNSRLFDNNCSYNGYSGIMLNFYCFNNTISGNTLFKNSNFGALTWRYCENNTFSGNIIKNNSVGIYFNGGPDWTPMYCRDIIISGNTIANNSNHGIELNHHIYNGTISGNIVKDNGGQGILLYWYTSDFLVTGNNVSYNRQHGIYIGTFCGPINVTKNIITFNGLTTDNYGIVFSNQNEGHIICDNYIFNNSNGIILVNRIQLCKIYNNDIINHTGKGIYLQYIGGWYVRDNLIYNNTFINNGDHALDEGSNNNWNNTLTGNYWDDYNGEDADDNGIGDSWYTVSGSVYDEIPIWWDAPVVSIIFPSLNNLFGNATIEYQITVEKANLNDPKFKMWYVLDNGYIRKNSTFTDLSSTIKYFLWNNFSSTFINITFYANDSRGWIGYMNVTVEKDITIPIITIQELGFYGASGFKPLNFTIYKSGKNLEKTWYRIWNNSYWTNNYTFTGLEGWVQQSLWNDLDNGTYTIQFFLNDSLSRLDYENGKIIKDIHEPILAITDPSDNDVIGSSTPSFTLNIDEGNLHKIWYNLNDTYGNFTYTNKISDTEWVKLGHGTVTVTFWANDTAGNTFFVGISVILIKDLVDPVIDDINSPVYGIVYGNTPPPYYIEITEVNFDYMYYTLFDGTNLIQSSTLHASSIHSTSFPLQSNSHPLTAQTVLSGSIAQSLWNPLNNGQINITFFIIDEGGNEGKQAIMVIRDVQATVAALLPDDDDDDGAAEDTMDWVVRALLAGLISGSVGISLRIAYSKIKKKREAAREAAAPTVVLKKKFQIVHHDLLTPYKKVEKKEFRVGIAQVGLSKTGNLITELYEMTPEGLMRIREDMVETVSANIKSMIESAHENKVNILLFPEMTFDLNYKEMVKDVKKWAQDYNMYIITGGYHDIKTKQNICAVFGPEGIQWEQEKHTPATIHFGKTVFTEAIEVHRPPHKIHICSTEYGRIAIAICRDFLDMDLRVEVKNCEPPVDLFFNPAYTPVTVDFEATHFDARRSVYAYTFFSNIADFGGTIINTPEKDRTKRMIPPKEEGLIFKDVDLFSLRSERRKWERRQSKEKRYIQSTRS